MSSSAKDTDGADGSAVSAAVEPAVDAKPEPEKEEKQWSSYTADDDGTEASPPHTRFFSCSRYNAVAHARCNESRASH